MKIELEKEVVKKSTLGLNKYSLEEIAFFQKEFLSKGFTRLPKLLSTELLKELLIESENIVKLNGKNKNLLMKSTNDTPRIMRTVGQDVISKKSKIIPELYASDFIPDLMSAIVDEKVFRAPWPPEEFVLSNLVRDGDTHGWHWDDYSFAIVLYLKSPEINQGGFVQTCAGGTWDKSNPKVNETLLNGSILTHRCEAGDGYILNAKKNLHRVTPICNGGERLIINMTWASSEDLKENLTHETNDILFAN